MRPQKSTRSAEDVDADEVAVEEVAVEGVKDEVVKVNKLQQQLGVPSTRVQNTQIFQQAIGWGAACISVTDEELTFVQNLGHAHGRMSLLQNLQPEDLTSSAKRLIH